MAAFAGIYELSEASRYLYVTAPEKRPNYYSLRRWVRSGLPSPEVRSVPAKDLFLTFEDLVSLRMITALRIAGFSLQHIRGVHKYLVNRTEYPRPFALRDLWVSETEIFTDMEGYFISATRRGQVAMEFIREWLYRLRRTLPDTLDLSFRKQNGNEIACAWMAYQCVLLDPLVQFGTPCIRGTRIPTKSVRYMFLGGDAPTAIARDYGVPLSDVECALEWEEKLAATDFSTIRHLHSN